MFLVYFLWGSVNAKPQFRWGVWMSRGHVFLQKAYTPLKINMDYIHGGLVQIMFLSKWAIL